jgi:hypothetical protein
LGGEFSVGMDLDDAWRIVNGREENLEAKVGRVHL